MSKRRRRKVQTILSCYASSLPGVDWSASVELRTVGHQVEVWATIDIEEELAPSEELMGVLPRRFSWREAAQLLANSYMGSLGGNFLKSVTVHGFDGIEADVLALAWMHGEEAHNGSMVARELLQLDDEALQELHRSERSFLTHEFVEAICEISREVSNGLSELIPYCAQAPEVPLSIGALHAALERWQGDEDLRAQQRAAKAATRSATLAPVQDQISWMVDRIAGPYTRGKWGPGNGERRAHVQRWIEEYWLKHGSMPEGPHDLDVSDQPRRTHIGVVDFSALNEELRRTISGDATRLVR